MIEGRISTPAAKNATAPSQYCTRMALLMPGMPSFPIFEAKADESITHMMMSIRAAFPLINSEMMKKNAVLKKPAVKGISFDRTGCRFSPGSLSFPSSPRNLSFSLPPRSDIVRAAAAMKSTAAAMMRMNKGDTQTPRFLSDAIRIL